MSHFSVLVVGDDPEQQLAPFQENNGGDCPQEYLAFFDKEDELLEEYNTESIEMVESPTGERYFSWDERFKVKKSNRSFDYEKVIPEDYKEALVPFKKHYATFEDFARGYHGYKNRDEKTGKYGYWDNPNKKWDWYQLGGRFRGRLLAKKDLQWPEDAALGEAGVFKNEPMFSADRLRKGDVDWEGMKAAKRAEAEDEWSKMEEITKGLTPPTISFEEIVLSLKNNGMTGESAIRSARETYQNHPWVKAANTLGNWLFEYPEEYFCLNTGGKEEFLRKSERLAITMFAVIKDGKWYEKGNMGWWGCVSDEKDEKKWSEEFNKLLEDFPDDTLLSIYDCHI